MPDESYPADLSFKLYNRDDLETLLNAHPSYLATVIGQHALHQSQISAQEVLTASDNRVRIITEHEKLILSPIGGVVRGWNFTDHQNHRAIHSYVYSAEFRSYVARANLLKADNAKLERHFFTYGVELGIWYKALNTEAND